MNRNDPVLQALRNELDEAKNDLRNYMTLYRNERDDRRQVEDCCIQLQQDLQNLTQRHEELREQLDACMNYIDSFEVSKPYKKWEDLVSSVTRAKRKAQYKKCLDQSMMYLHEVKWARIQLRIGENEVVFV